MSSEHGFDYIPGQCDGIVPAGAVFDWRGWSQDEEGWCPTSFYFIDGDIPVHYCDVEYFRKHVEPRAFEIRAQTSVRKKSLDIVYERRFAEASARMRKSGGAG